MKKQKIQEKIMFRKGNSFVELLTIIGIIGIMTAVTYASMSSLRTGKEVEVAARQIASLIREVQNNAVSGKMMNGDTTCRFYIEISNSGNNLAYRVSYRHDGGSGCDSASSVQYSSGTIEKVNAVIPPLGPSAITIPYNVPHGATSGFNVVLRSSVDSSKQYVICTSSTGNIEEKEGSTCP